VGGVFPIRDNTRIPPKRGILVGLWVWARVPFFRLEACERGTSFHGKVCERVPIFKKI